MYVATIGGSSRTSAFSNFANPAHYSKPAVKITLKGEDTPGGTPHSYTTRDHVAGEVSFTAPHDTRFDDVHITFEGTTKTWLEKFGATAPGTPARTEASQMFLKMTQPVDETLLPQPRVAEKGKTYTFPFSFVIPSQLLISACSHAYTDDSAIVQANHLALPPSLGDAALPSEGGVLQDDLAPDMSKISYAIRVRVVRRRNVDNKPQTLVDSSRRVRVTPLYSDSPPMSIDDHADDGYVLRKEKEIRKGLFKGKLGKLILSAEQPSPMRTSVGSSRRANIYPATTMANMSVVFLPSSENAEPPRLESLTAKLKASTFFATRPMRRIVSTRKSQPLDSMNIGNYSTNLTLASRCLSAVKWEKHYGPYYGPPSDHPASSSRRGTFASTTSTSSDPSTITHSTSSSSAGASSGCGVYYTAPILVPLTQPKDKLLVPSFQSCLVARSYSLDICVNAHVGPERKLQGLGMSLTLKMPLQISSVPSGSAPGSEYTASLTTLGDVPAYSLTSSVNSTRVNLPQAASGVEEFFTPRSVAPPAGVPVLADRLQGSALPAHMLQHPANTPPPPGYTIFQGPALREGVPGGPVRIPSPVGISPGCG